MTLGFDPESRVWPIFMGQHKEDRVGVPVDIAVGDLVMYHGEELPHWRNEYKGKWQVQVFFHYVDKNGENAKHAGDKVRKTVQDVASFKPAKSIIHDGIMIRTCDDVFPGLSTFHSKNSPELCFTPKECDTIISLANQLYEVKGTTGTGENEGTYNEEIRSVDVYDLPLEEGTKWIFDKLATAAAKANKEYYNYNLLGITHSLQLLHYKPGGHYDWHIDAGNGASATRKLTALVPLSKRTDFEGGGLKAQNNATEMDVIMERGSISTFPSYMPHKVEPVTSGERWTLVTWIHGPDRFK
jgi:PKHD-type hydroxylase